MSYVPNIPDLKKALETEILEIKRCACGAITQNPNKQGQMLEKGKDAMKNDFIKITAEKC